MSVTGTWNLTIKTPMGQQKVKAHLAEEAGKLNGSMDDQTNPSGPIQEATVDGDRLGWKFPVRKPFPTTLTFSLTVDGDKLTGTCKAGVFPLAPVVGVRA